MYFLFFKLDLQKTWFCRCNFREPELVLLDMQSVPAGQEGWLAFDVTSASNHWLLQPRSNLGIRLYVETEDGEHLISHWLKKIQIIKVLFRCVTVSQLIVFVLNGSLEEWYLFISSLCSFPLSDRSLSAGWVGLVGRRGPRSKQPFMVTFFRASQAPCRPPRALRHNTQRRKKHKNDLPHPNRPGLFGKGSWICFRYSA